jgi:hypothetical protein
MMPLEQCVMPTCFHEILPPCPPLLAVSCQTFGPASPSATQDTGPPSRRRYSAAGNRCRAPRDNLVLGRGGLRRAFSLLWAKRLIAVARALARYEPRICQRRRVAAAAAGIADGAMTRDVPWVPWLHQALVTRGNAEGNDTPTELKRKRLRTKAK